MSRQISYNRKGDRTLKKRFLIPVFIAAVALVGSFGFSAMAISDDFEPAWGRCYEDGPGPGMRGFGRLAAVLDLTDEQEDQIEAIMEAERSTMMALRKQMREGRDELSEITKSGGFDETAVREVADRIAKAKTEMIVSRTRMKSKIFAVLTPEQRELADELQPLMGHKRGHRRGPF